MIEETAPSPAEPALAGLAAIEDVLAERLGESRVRRVFGEMLNQTDKGEENGQK